MVKKVLCSILFVALFSLAYSQTNTARETKPVVGQTEIVQKTPALGLLSDKVNDAHAAYLQSATLSRTDAAKAKTAYQESLDNYLAELEHQLLSANATQSEEIRNEIALVKKLRNDLNGTSTR